MSTWHRKGIRTGRCWLISAARSTRHKATPGRTAGSSCCRSPICQKCGQNWKSWTPLNGCKNRTASTRSRHEQQTVRQPRRVDHRVTCILQQRCPAHEIRQWVGLLKGKQQSVACAILRCRPLRPTQLALPTIATEVPSGALLLAAPFIAPVSTIDHTNPGVAEQLSSSFQPPLHQTVTDHR